MNLLWKFWNRDKEKRSGVGFGTEPALLGYTFYYLTSAMVTLVTSSPSFSST